MRRPSAYFAKHRRGNLGRCGACPTRAIKSRAPTRQPRPTWRVSRPLQSKRSPYAPRSNQRSHESAKTCKPSKSRPTTERTARRQAPSIPATLVSSSNMRWLRVTPILSRSMVALRGIHSSGNPALLTPSNRGGRLGATAWSHLTVSLGLRRRASAKAACASSILPTTA